MPCYYNIAYKRIRYGLRPTLFILIWFISVQIFGQNNPVSNVSKIAVKAKSENLATPTGLDVLLQIRQLQSNGEGYYPKGAFASQRKYYWSTALKEDDNLFFTAFILFQLQRYKGQMLQNEIVIAQDIIAAAMPYFVRFQHAQKRPTYNFWQKNPPVIFPNGGWLNHFNISRALPDDIDDCALATLAIGRDIYQVDSMKHLFVQYKNTQLKTANSFYTKYKNAPVYSTWLGNKFPIDIDICVLSNVLVMNYATETAFNATDSASLQLIIQLIKDKKHIKDARYVSQHYQNTPNILYHIARLMHYSKDSSLCVLKPLIISQAKIQLQQSHKALEQLLLKNTLLQLGETSPELICRDLTGLTQKNYSFFIANMSAVLNNPLKRIVSFTRLGTFNYYCDAFNLSLVLENILLTRKTL
jgi:hypothetical protein